MRELLRTVIWQGLFLFVGVLCALSTLLIWVFNDWSFRAVLICNLLGWGLFLLYLFLLRDVVRSRYLNAHKEYGVSFNPDGQYVSRREAQRLKSFIIPSGPTGEDENKIELMIRFHWWQEVRKPQFFVLLGMMAIVLWVAIDRYQNGQGDWRFAWWQVLLFELIPMAAMWIQAQVWASRFLMATNLRCMVVRSAPLLIEPFMRKTSAQVDFRRLDVINMEQLFWGRVLRYGTLKIDTTVQGDVDFNNLQYVPHVDAVHLLLEQTRREARGLK